MYLIYIEIIKPFRVTANCECGCVLFKTLGTTPGGWTVEHMAASSNLVSFLSRQHSVTSSIEHIGAIEKPAMRL